MAECPAPRLALGKECLESVYDLRALGKNPMEPTGIEPVTSCLQSSFRDDLEKARKRLKAGERRDPAGPLDGAR
jgi:hypothetical protein